MLQYTKGVISMKTITVRLNEEETKAFNAYAALNDMPLSTLLKKTLEEKMEDEFDMLSILEYQTEKEGEMHTHAEVKSMLNL